MVIAVEFGAGPGGRRRTGRHPASASAGFADEQHTLSPQAGAADMLDCGLFEDLDIELTPRQRRFVEVAAWTLADDVYDAIEDLAEIPDFAAHEISVLNDFPPCTWTQTATWWREQARCCDDLASEAAAGIDPEPRCTGEEMALHLILQRAQAIASDPTDIRADLTAGLPACEGDSDWDGPLDFLFQDHDVLMLFDNDADGYAEPHSSTVNLALEKWFDPFADSPPRSGHRGFRR